MLDDIARLSELLPGIVSKVVMAIICGGMIGLELSRKRQHPTALRDNLLVCLGVVLYVIAGDLFGSNGDSASNGHLTGYVSYIIIAVGLITAGMIVTSKGEKDSLATAASVWVVAAIGLIIGAGFPMLALLVTGATLLTMTLLRGFEKHFTARSKPLLLKLTVREDNPEVRRKLESVLEKFGIKPEAFRSEQGAFGYKLTISAQDEPEDVRALTAKLWTLDGVTEVEH